MFDISLAPLCELWPLISENTSPASGEQPPQASLSLLLFYFSLLDNLTGLDLDLTDIFSQK